MITRTQEPKPILVSSRKKRAVGFRLSERTVSQIKDLAWWSRSSQGKIIETLVEESWLMMIANKE